MTLWVSWQSLEELLDSSLDSHFCLSGTLDWRLGTSFLKLWNKNILVDDVRRLLVMLLLRLTTFNFIKRSSLNFVQTWWLQYLVNIEHSESRYKIKIFHSILRRMNNMFAPSKCLLLISFFYLMVEGRSHVKIEEQYRKVTFLVRFLYFD